MAFVLSLWLSLFTARRWLSVALAGLLTWAWAMAVTGFEPPRMGLDVLPLSAGVLALRAIRKGAPPPGIGPLWRGELSVPRSFIHLPFCLALQGAVSVSWGLADSGLYPRLISSIRLGLLLSLVPCFGAIVVGTWRASLRSERLWPFRTLLIYVACLQLVVLGLERRRIGRDLGALSKLDEPPEVCIVRTLRGGREIDFRCKITDESVRRFAALLSPQTKTIFLSSPGGFVSSGISMAKEIEGRGLQTVVQTSCNSACVTAFAGGEVRVLSRSAVLGIHGPFGIGRATEVARDAVRSYLVARGARAAFVDRGLRVSFEDLWYPTHREIIDAGLAHRMAEPGQLRGFDVDVDEFERSISLRLGDDPLFAAIREKEPAKFEDFVDAARSAATDGDFQGTARMESLIERTYSEIIPRLSNESAFKLAAWAYANRRNARGPCESRGPPVGPRITGVPAEAYLEFWTSPGPALRESDVAADLSVLADRIDRVDPDECEDESTRAMEVLLSLPKDRAGRLMRYLASTQ
ncbi:MAG: hypothetical protein HYV07_01430 [Deltaproteobacteria bacterium]|nr:hypothetical protein [Deltaproteobacteria bacterium]